MTHVECSPAHRQWDRKVPTRPDHGQCSTMLIPAYLIQEFGSLIGIRVGGTHGGIIGRYQRYV